MWVGALWAAIQAQISKIDFDFWGWATERWGRAVQKMDSTAFSAMARAMFRHEGVSPAANAERITPRSQFCRGQKGVNEQ